MSFTVKKKILQKAKYELLKSKEKKNPELQNTQAENKSFLLAWCQKPSALRIQFIMVKVQAPPPDIEHSLNHLAYFPPSPSPLDADCELIGLATPWRTILPHFPVTLVSVLSILVPGERNKCSAKHRVRSGRLLQSLYCCPFPFENGMD